MAYLVLLFLDLASLPIAKGDDALYRQAMADHHLNGGYDTEGQFIQCAEVANHAPDLQAFVGGFVFQNVQRGMGHHLQQPHFSLIAWKGDRAFLQLTTSDATSCLLYRKAGVSYRLVREIRLPH